MANIKITDLTAYGNPTSTDVLPIVDVGADVTKKVSVADLLENAGSGTAAAPGIAFDGDSNTGIYRPGTDQVALSTNGTERVEFGTSEVVFNDGGENYDFRVEGDTNSSLFFVDASADAVGIGTTSPSATLEVIGDAKIGETSYLLRFAAGASTGVIEFPDTSARSVVRTLGATPLEFEINSSPAARFDTSGRLLVGTSTSAGSKQMIFQNAAEDALTIRVQSGSYPYNWINLDRQGTSGTAVISGSALGIINFRGWDGSTAVSGASIYAAVDGTPGANDMPGRLIFSTTADGASTPTERMRIKSNGTINFSNVSVYADNAAAKTGGLVDGDVYRTSTGDLKIVYS